MTSVQRKQLLLVDEDDRPIDIEGINVPAEVAGRAMMKTRKLAEEARKRRKLWHVYM